MNDRQERTNELGRLVSLLPLANYTLLRTLSAHLIRIVENSGINKMTLRNIGIVFSATLGIPAVVFNLFLSEFDYVFWTKQDDKSVIPDFSQQTQPQENVNNNNNSNNNLNEYHAYTNSLSNLNNASFLSINNKCTSHARSNRNSIHYLESAPHSIVKLEKRTQSK